MGSKVYDDKLLEICDNDEDLMAAVIYHFVSNIHLDFGFKNLREILKSNQKQFDSLDHDNCSEIDYFNIIFKKFLKWYLETQYTREIILNGK